MARGALRGTGPAQYFAQRKIPPFSEILVRGKMVGGKYDEGSEVLIGVKHSVRLKENAAPVAIRPRSLSLR